MKNFDGLGLHHVLARSLTQMKYDTPTPIQAQAIPIALQGRDILGSAQTGTGKTAAFSIPLLEQLLNSERGTALVMTPTRELGKQVMDVMLQMLGPKSPIKTAFLIGGEAMHKQCQQLRQRPRLVVGTPGRINDHLERGNLDLDQAEFLVLDEMDRMLDMGFSVQIDRIVKYMPEKRQTLLFSATMPDSIIKMAKKYQNNPERISVGSTFNPVKNIKQDIIHVAADKKYPELINELHARSGSVIIFVKTKRGADKMAKKLSSDDFDACAIHGDLQQRKRDRVIREYRNKQFRILVATDVVARGLDVPHIEHVINYDLPQVPEDYIHRIGRTARAGAKGSSLCMITPQDGRKWNAIEILMDPSKKPARGPARNDNSTKNRGNSKYGKNKRFDSSKKFSKGKRSDTRDGENRNEGRSYNKGKNFKRDDRDGENRHEGRKSEGRSFNKDKRFNNRDDRNGENRNEGRKNEGRSFNNDRLLKRDDRNSDNRSEGRKSEGRSFNKDKSYNTRDERNGESRKNFKRDDRDGENRKSNNRSEGRNEGRRDDRNSEGKTFAKPSKGGKNFGRDDKRKKDDRNNNSKKYGQYNKGGNAGGKKNFSAPKKRRDAA
ncbi:MAG: ATP-dependent RNA helicase [Alphaproteobacteria bacterium]|nr:MAG: ATP-dependent RNA helicase [Alphaproteobacteria bacterium]